MNSLKSGDLCTSCRRPRRRGDARSVSGTAWLDGPLPSFRVCVFYYCMLSNAAIWAPIMHFTRLNAINASQDWKIWNTLCAISSPLFPSKLGECVRAWEAGERERHFPSLPVSPSAAAAAARPSRACTCTTAASSLTRTPCALAAAAELLKRSNGGDTRWRGGGQAGRQAARCRQSCDALEGGRGGPEFIELLRRSGSAGAADLVTDGRVAQSATLVKCSGGKGARPPACLPPSPGAVFARIELFGRCIAKLYADV